MAGSQGINTVFLLTDADIAKVVCIYISRVSVFRDFISFRFSWKSNTFCPSVTFTHLCVCCSFRYNDKVNHYSNV